MVHASLDSTGNGVGAKRLCEREVNIMANIISRASVRAGNPERQAYQLLHVAFVAAPVIAGLDKFAHLLTNWDQYLAPPFASILGAGAHGFMLVVGVVEVIAGLIVA